MSDELERHSFELWLKKLPCCSTTRLVFSDWLEERGLDSEAQEQRRMASPEWVEAYQYMEGIASRAGKQCSNYEEVSKERWDEHRKTGKFSGKTNYTYRDITVDDLINAGIDFIESEEKTVQIGSEDLRNLWGFGIDPDEFWKNLSIITGRQDTPPEGSPFTCSC